MTSRRTLNRIFWVFGLIFLRIIPVSAQKANYAAAEKYDIDNLYDKTETSNVIPFFFKNSNKFWFFFQDDNDKNYYFIDPVKKERRLLFDRKVIMDKLREQEKEKVDSSALRFNMDFNMNDNQRTIEVAYKEKSYLYNFYTKVLSRLPSQNPKKYESLLTGQVSPNKEWILFARKHNLYIKHLVDSTETALSTDAEPYYSFELNEEDTVYSENSQTEALWSKNSFNFYVLRKDNRKVKNFTVLHSTSPDLWTESYKYQRPGDKQVTQYEIFVGNTINRKLVRVKADHWTDQELTIVQANDPTEDLFFLRKKRTKDEVELCVANVNTGEVRVIIHENCKPYLNEDLFNVKILNGGKDILWWSDRTGWGQYYLYNSDGKLKNSVTNGNWTAGEILNIDTGKREIYIYGYGREPGRNPYYAHVYKIRLDGKYAHLITPEDASHQAVFSPTGQYFVDNFSKINQLPKTVLRNTKGVLVLSLAEPKFKKLFNYGWRMPEPFVVKAADGVTDLYGIMWKPFNFDPSKKYPVISQVYPGPQTETVWTDFTVFDKYNNTPLAQLGFIVVCMGHRGGSPLRNKQYATFGYGNLRDAPLEDDKYGLEQLAKRYNYIDLDRVGIFGHSGGGMMSTAAICTYPDFYKVAVSSSGNHDNSFYNRSWGETYEGVKELVDSINKDSTKSEFQYTTNSNLTLAKNLKGHLLLVTGEVDKNVHPGHTYRMVKALIEADLDFDLLVLPDQSHQYEGIYKKYFEKQKRKYFAKYLIEQKP